MILPRTGGLKAEGSFPELEAWQWNEPSQNWRPRQQNDPSQNWRPESGMNLPRTGDPGSRMILPRIGGLKAE